MYFVETVYRSRPLSLQRNSTLRVGNLETERLSLGDNLNSVLRRNVVGNLSSVGLGVHQQNVQVSNVLDNVDSETSWVHELGLLVGTVTDVWLRDGTSESSSDTRVNTLLLSPVLSNSVVSVRVVSLELTNVLLHNLWSSHCLLVFKSGVKHITEEIVERGINMLAVLTLMVFIYLCSGIIFDELAG